MFGQEQKRREDERVREHHITEQLRALSILKQPMLLLREELFAHGPGISSIPYGFSCELTVTSESHELLWVGCTGHSKENPTRLPSKATIIQSHVAK